MAPRKIVRNEFGGFSPLDEFGNLIPQSVPAPIRSTPRGQVNEFGDILQSSTSSNQPSIEELQGTQEVIKTKIPEQLKVDKIAPGSRPAGRTLTPQEEFLASEQERRIIMEGGRKVDNTNPSALPEGVTIPDVIGVEGQAPEGVFGKTFGNIVSTEILFNKIARGEKLTRDEKAMADKLALNNLDFKVLQDGEVDINEMSRTLEAMPILGKIKGSPFGFRISIADIAGKSPGSKIQELLGTIDKNAGDIGEMLDMFAKTGNPLWLQKANEHKNEILRLESRIKLLGIVSPEIQNSKDNSKEITRRITDAKNNYPQLEWFS